MQIINSNFLRRGLVGHWGYRGNGSVLTSEAVHDLSGNGNTGTCNGNTYVDSDGAHFDGSGDGIVVPNSSELYPTSQITICGWINPITLGLNAICYGDYNIASYGVIFDGSGICRFGISGAWRLYSNTVPPTNVCTHVACTYDGTNTGIYYNAVVDSSGTYSGSIGTTSDSLGIGCVRDLSYVFNGVIDDFRIYNRALSTAEIKQLYHQGKWRQS